MNDRLIVHGGKKLKGDYKIQGSKNEAFEVMCACLLTKETVVIKNIPNIVDVTNLINVFKLLNVKIEKINDHDYSFCAKDMFNVDQVDFNVLKSFITQLRGGVMILGPMVARFKKAIIPMPGGDKIGRRRLDTHFYGLSKLNVVSYFDEKLQSYVNNLRKNFEAWALKYKIDLGSDDKKMEALKKFTAAYGNQMENDWLRMLGQAGINVGTSLGSAYLMNRIIR
jgi:UDP-N-acetylglucosamine 1-carboxyvinyltransferase